MLKTPIDFVRNVETGKHVVLFYEDAEYARNIAFSYIKWGLQNKEQCFYISSKEDDEFIRREFEEDILGMEPGKGKFLNQSEIAKNNLFNVTNIPNFYDYPGGLERATRSVVDIVNFNLLFCSKTGKKDIGGNHYGIGDDYSRTGGSNGDGGITKAKRVVLRCVHKVETQQHMTKNMEWERQYRNTVLRKELPSSSLICTYPVENILSTIDGKSSSHSQWMAELLELYDAVVYANLHWKGAAFNLA